MPRDIHPNVTFEFEPDSVCGQCGAVGAWNFKRGCYLCAKCAGIYQAQRIYAVIEDIKKAARICDWFTKVVVGCLIARLIGAWDRACDKYDKYDV